jgi:hypothetical protein
MTSLLLLAFAQAAATAPAPPLPRDWSTLPPLALSRRARPEPQDTSAVVDLGRRQPECRASFAALAGSDEFFGVRIDLAVLVNPDGTFRSIVAKAGPCDAIRNYARSVVHSRFRGQATPPPGPAPAWYGTTLTFFGRP